MIKTLRWFVFSLSFVASLSQAATVNPSPTAAANALAARLASQTGTVGASMVGTRAAGTGAIGRTLAQKLGDIDRNAADFGVACDGVDRSTQMQAAVDAVAAIGGGVLQVNPCATPYVMKWTQRQGVIVVGALGAAAQYYTGDRLVTVQAPPAGGYVVDWPAATITGAGLIGVRIYGLGAGTPVVGIRVRNANTATLYDIGVHNTADEGIRIESTTSLVDIEKVLIVNPIRNQTRAANIFAFYVEGQDHRIDNVEASASLTALSSANRYIRAAGIFGAGHRVQHLIGEFADVPCTFGGLNQHVDSIRCEFGFAENLEISTIGGIFNQVYSDNGSMSGANTYDGIVLLASSAYNIITAWTDHTSGAGIVRYGLSDLQASATTKNIVGPGVSGAQTAPYRNVATGGTVMAIEADANTLTVNSATPSVAGGSSFVTLNTATTNITNFTNGFAGKRLRLYCADSNTTIVHDGVNIATNGGGNLRLVAGRVYEFERYATTWREVEADRAGVMTLTNADATYQVGLNGTVVILNVAITAGRNLLLSNTGARAGDVVRVVRTAAATGAFVLSVNAPSALKTLNAGQFADFVFNGSAWLQLSFGSL